MTTKVIGKQGARQGLTLKFKLPEGWPSVGKPAVPAEDSLSVVRIAPALHTVNQREIRIEEKRRRREQRERILRQERAGEAVFGYD